MGEICPFSILHSSCTADLLWIENLISQPAYVLAGHPWIKRAGQRLFNPNVPIAKDNIRPLRVAKVSIGLADAIINVIPFFEHRVFR